MNHQEEEMKRVFKRYMAEEIGSGEIARAKKEFMRKHFTELPPIFLRPAYLIPALSLVFVLLIIFETQKAPIQPRIQPIPPAVLQTKPMEPIPYRQMPVPVMVRQVSSEVGPTMVYQKKGRDVPVTIIWVFTGGGNQ